MSEKETHGGVGAWLSFRKMPEGWCVYQTTVEFYELSMLGEPADSLTERATSRRMS